MAQGGRAYTWTALRPERWVEHQRFLKNYQDKGYIYLKEIKDLALGINEILLNKPKVNYPKDNLKVSDALNKIL